MARARAGEPLRGSTSGRRQRAGASVVLLRPLSRPTAQPAVDCPRRHLPPIGEPLHGSAGHLACQERSLQRVGAAPAASSTPTRKIATEADPARPEAGEARASVPPAPAGQPGLIQATPVRSGQQVYADNRDLTVLATVGAGAEVIADGSVHIYGTLRGRALAGAQGNEKARIFCRAFHAELVAIAGNYKVLEEIPKELHGKAVQVWLDGGQLKIAALE